jgi:hypothetical protein
MERTYVWGRALEDRGEKRRMTPFVRILILALSFEAAGAVVKPALASADDKAECIAAHEGGQVARRDGRFDRAREAFAACQRDACPAVIRTRCAEFARDLEAVQPTLVVLVRDTQGADAGDARVSIDGAPLTAVSAMALRLNPGKHLLRAEAPGFVSAEKTVVLPESVHDMMAVVSLQRPLRAAALTVGRPPASARSSTAAWAFTLAGGVSLVAAGVLDGVGWAVHDQLKSSCGATGCSDSQVESLRIVWPASFAMLAIGVASGVVATVLFATRSDGSAAALLPGRAAAGIRF